MSKQQRINYFSHQVAYASTTRGWSHSWSMASNSSPVTIGAAFVSSAMRSVVSLRCPVRRKVQGTAGLDRHVAEAVCGWLAVNANADEAVTATMKTKDERAIFTSIFSVVYGGDGCCRKDTCRTILEVRWILSTE